MKRYSFLQCPVLLMTLYFHYALLLHLLVCVCVLRRE